MSRDLNEIAISQTAADAVGQEVESSAVRIVLQSGVPIVIRELNVGRVNPPDAVRAESPVIRTGRVAVLENRAAVCVLDGSEGNKLQ